METKADKTKWFRLIPVGILCAFVVVGIWDIPVVAQAVLLAIKRLDVLGIVTQVGGLLQTICVAVLVVLCLDKLKSDQARRKKLLEICFWIFAVVAAGELVSRGFAWVKDGDTNFVLPTIVSFTKAISFFIMAKTIRKNAQDVTPWVVVLIIAGVLAGSGYALVGSMTRIKGLDLIGSLWEIAFLGLVWEAGISYMEFASVKELRKTALWSVGLGFVVIVLAVAAASGDSGEITYSAPRAGMSASEYIKRQDPQLYYSILRRYNSLFRT